MNATYARISDEARLGANLLADYLLCNDNQRVFWEILFPALTSDKEHPEYRAIHTNNADIVFLIEPDRVSYTMGSGFELLVTDPGENEADLSMGDLLVDALVGKFSFYLTKRLGRADMADKEAILQFDSKISIAIDSRQLESELLSVLLCIQSHIQQYQAGFPDYLIISEED